MYCYTTKQKHTEAHLVLNVTQSNMLSMLSTTEASELVHYKYTPTIINRQWQQSNVSDNHWQYLPRSASRECSEHTSSVWPDYMVIKAQPARQPTNSDCPSTLTAQWPTVLRELDLLCYTRWHLWLWPVIAISCWWCHGRQSLCYRKWSRQALLLDTMFS